MTATPSKSGGTIHIVYPHANQTIYEDSTFVMGAVQPVPTHHTLFLNDQPLTLSPHGFFSSKIPIHAGQNKVRLSVKPSVSSPASEQTTLTLTGASPLAILPPQPLAIHPETLQPKQAVWLTAHDRLTLSCAASEGAQVEFKIPGLVNHWLPIAPLHSAEPFLDTRENIFAHRHWTHPRIPVRGYYQTSVAIADLLQQQASQAIDKTSSSSNLSHLPILLRLSHGNEHLESRFPGTLSILTQPRTARVQTDRAVTRTAPENGARLTPQRAGTLVQIDGLDRAWARVRLSRDEVFYLAETDLHFESLTTQHLSHSSPPTLEKPKPQEHSKTSLLPLYDASPAPASLAFIKTQGSSLFSSVVRLTFSGQTAAHVPIAIEPLPSSQTNRLQVRLYNVCSQCDFIHYPSDDAIIRQIHWRTITETVLEVWIDLHRPLSGYDYTLNNDSWEITVKTLPQPLENIRILIDPGHGGAETGSVGLNGLPEKTLNLTVSKLLQDALQTVGFPKVFLSRQTDHDLSLAERGQATLATQADIVLSIHHNALPDGRDPQQERGSCTFYYQPFAKPLADALAQGLTSPDNNLPNPLPSYGVFYDSLYMTRIHQATAVLAELGFFTHPDDFEHVIQPAFQQAEATRIAQTLRDYCQTISK